MNEATETESWQCTVVSSMDRMQLNNSRRQQSHGSIITTWGPSNQIQLSPFLSRCSTMHVMGFCSAISTRLFIYYQNQQLLPVSGGSESVVITVSCTSEANTCPSPCQPIQGRDMQLIWKFDIHGSVHHRWFNRNTNKMQLCNRMYYSKVYWRLNMFRAAHRSSSGALNCVCSLWFIYPCGDRPLPRLSAKCISHSTLTTAGHLMGI